MPSRWRASCEKRSRRALKVLEIVSSYLFGPDIRLWMCVCRLVGFLKWRPFRGNDFLSPRHPEKFHTRYSVLDWAFGMTSTKFELNPATKYFVWDSLNIATYPCRVHISSGFDYSNPHAHVLLCYCYLGKVFCHHVRIMMDFAVSSIALRCLSGGLAPTRMGKSSANLPDVMFATNMT